MSEERSRAVARALVDAGALVVRPEQPVTFRSGMRSPMYVDGRRLISHPGPWRTVVDALGSALEEASIGAEVIAGVEAAGIPHSSALAFATGRPSVFVRKAPKGHGLGRRIEGGDVAGRRVVLVEDLVTSGGSSLDAVGALRDADATVTDCLAVTTYGFAGTHEAFASAGVRLTVLTTIDAILDAALASGAVDPGSARVAREWLADPTAWTSPRR